MANSEQRAFILRMTPGGHNKLPEGLRKNEIILGWGKVKGLENEDSFKTIDNFRDEIRAKYHSTDHDSRRSGQNAGTMWRFIRIMKEGDLVVVPDEGKQFFICKVAGRVFYVEDKVPEESTYRRRVEWLNGKKPIQRDWAPGHLQSRLKIQQTCSDATDLIPQIREVMSSAEKGKKPSFYGDLRQALVSRTKEKVLGGYIDHRGFEKILVSLIKSLGGRNVQNLGAATRYDKGADIIADFPIGGSVVKFAVQAKYYKPNPPAGKEAIEELLGGIREVFTNTDLVLGWLVTSGKFSAEAKKYVQDLDLSNDESNIKIHLIDGDALAELLLENDIKSILGPSQN